MFTGLAPWLSTCTIRSPSAAIGSAKNPRTAAPSSAAGGSPSNTVQS
ncbi:hypothetical protein ACFQY7_17510 [Actinomadura luteofluorescens]